MKITRAKFGKIIGAIALTLILIISIAGLSIVGSSIVGPLSNSALASDSNNYYESAEEHYKYASIGTEEAEGVPYWIWLVLPRLFPEKLSGPGGYTALGMTWEPGHELPVGFTNRNVGGIQRVGINCATCHHSTYRLTKTDVPIVVPTGPATKFNPQGYVRFLSDCASDPRFTADYILSEISQNHHLSWFDQLLYRFVIIPATRKALLQQKESYAWMDERPNWGPGRIDPFNPVKFRTLGLALDNTIGNSDMMPIWNEAAHEGYAFHWDGLETSLTETVNTGAIGDGATKISINIPGLQRVEAFIRDYQPPKYPFSINPELVQKGASLFDVHCAVCHAPTGDRTGHVIPLSEVGTDYHRLEMWTEEAAITYNQFGEGYDWDFDHLRKTDGYVAVDLEGLWLRAPYLHNGSVPTLEDLLETPENRPHVFYRGYDVYDSNHVGFISYGPDAEKAGFYYDVTVPGNGNQGHIYGVDLTSDEKTALVEYLKTL